LPDDVLASTPILALDFTEPMPPNGAAARTTYAYSLGAAVFMSAEQRSHRVAYPQLEQTNVFSKLSALQTVSVLKHSMYVFGCNTWVGGYLGAIR
jgi:hypothetical protein